MKNSKHSPRVWYALCLTLASSLASGIALAQDGAAGIQEADSQVRSYFEPGTNLMYAIGAVLGLIQVMQHLDDINEVGRGIATAFVATIYGVGVANLLCLPAAGKLKIRHREEQMVKEMMLEGVTSILEGMNPRMLETKLRTFLMESKGKHAEGAAA